MAVIAGGIFASCDNSMPADVKEEYRDPYMGSGLIAAPDAIISVGNTILSNTFTDFKIQETKSGDESESTRAVDKNHDPQVEVHLALGKVNTIPENVGKFDAIDTDLACQISIHDRYAGDVEVIIPIPEDLYCDPDSVKAHKGNPNYVFSGEKASFSNYLNGRKVTLYVEFVSSKNDDLTNPDGVSINGVGNFGSGYIRVYTEGINEDVMAFCNRKFFDGLNFKVYTYFKLAGQFAGITEADIRHNFLDHSLVNFDWQQTDVKSKSYPALYVNSFSMEDSGSQTENECMVRILGDREAKVFAHGIYDRPNQKLRNGTLVVWNESDTEGLDIERNHFMDPYQDNHFNSSPYNWLYEKK